METRAVERDDRGDRTAVEWGAAGRPLVVARRARAGRTEALEAVAMPVINSSAQSSGKGATCASSSRVSGARRTVRPRAVAGALLFYPNGYIPINRVRAIGESATARACAPVRSSPIASSPDSRWTRRKARVEKRNSGKVSDIIKRRKKRASKRRRRLNGYDAV